MTSMREIRIEKVTVNMGVGQTGEELDKAVQILEKITGGESGHELLLLSDQNAYRMNAGGITWNRIFSLGKQGMLNAIIPEKTNRLFILTSEGVFESKDSAQTWQKTFSMIGLEVSNSEILTALSQGKDLSPQEVKDKYGNTQKQQCEENDHANDCQTDSDPASAWHEDKHDDSCGCRPDPRPA